MSTSINWPPTLPQNAAVSGYGEGGGMNIAISPMDAGPPKLRKVSSRADQITVTYLMTTSQVATFETFAKTTTSGIKRFNWQHPRTAVSKEVRFVPGKDGEFYRILYIGPAFYSVAFTLEILP